MYLCDAPKEVYTSKKHYFSYLIRLQDETIGRLFNFLATNISGITNLLVILRIVLNVIKF
jgi:hypothetical protein